MRDQVAELVHPVLMHGLDLKERLERGELPDLKYFESEQSEFKRLLSDPRWGAVGQDVGGFEMTMRGNASIDVRDRSAGHFLGIRYALVCWVDEIIIDLYQQSTPGCRLWAEHWNERKLETDLFRTNDRAERFWEQARVAETKPWGADALEVFYLCVMLGFRGAWRDKPDQLRNWVDIFQPKIAANQGGDPPSGGQDTPPTYVPPRYYREQFRRVSRIWWGVILILVPLLVLGAFRLINS